MKTKYFVLMLIFLILTECKKNEETITINGITETDSFGQIIGSVDKTDWRTDDKWIGREESLFQNITISDNKLSMINKSSILNDTLLINPAYPNPVKDKIILSFINGIGHGNVEFVFVDRYFKILQSKRMDIVVGQYAILFDLDDSIFKTNNLYRIYYKLDINNSIYKGHGDIKKL